jgi:predicted DCC family thiol-disulfide oxidoreductase YuxK
MNNLKKPGRKYQITVFYDGGCPLCRREIQHYRRMRGADRVEWVDVTRQTEKLCDYGISLEQAMARFHVREIDSGRWLTGAYGFAALWRQLPAMRWLAISLEALRLIPAMDWLYTHFARHRIKKRCSGKACRL